MNAQPGNSGSGWIGGVVLLLVYVLLARVEAMGKEAAKFYRQVREKLGIPPEEK